MTWQIKKAPAAAAGALVLLCFTACGVFVPSAPSILSAPSGSLGAVSSEAPGAQSAASAGPAQNETDYEGFLRLLTENGFEYTAEAPGTGELFSVPNNPVYIGEELINAYEYPTAEALEEAADGIGDGGYSITRPDGGVAMVSWVAPPHFFKKSTLMLCYVGEDEAILNFLRANYGGEFA